MADTQEEISESPEEERELLLDREAMVEAVADDERPYGAPGARFNRRSPYWIGMVGGLGVATAVFIAWTVYSARQVLLLIGLALFLAIGLEPIVTQLVRRRVPRRFAVLIVSLAAVAVVAGFLALAIPPLVDEGNKLISLAPHYLQELNNRSSFLGHLNSKYKIISHVKQALSGGGIGSVTSGVLGAGKVVLGAVTSLFIVIALTIYFLADLPRVTKTIYRMVPRSRRARAGLLIDEMFARVGGYVLGNMLTSLIAGVGTLIWLAIFGVPYPILLAVFVALMDLIPIVGSTVAGVVVALVAVTVSVPTALATAGFYIVYRNAEDYLITPRVMRRTVEMPGLATVLAVLVGGALLGIIGALVAIPVAAGIKLLLEQVSYPRLDES